MAIKVIKYRALHHQAGALKGFIGVQLDKIPSMEIHEIAHFDGENGPGIGLPNRTYEKRDGSTGRQYFVYIADENVRNKFSSAVLKALETYFEENPDKRPGAEADDGGYADEDIPF